MNFCCKKFEEQAGNLQAVAGGGFLLPTEALPMAQFQPAIDGKTWNINGCCGGGCFVVTKMEYCPYCGNKLKCEPAGS